MEPLCPLSQHLACDRLLVLAEGNRLTFECCIDLLGDAEPEILQWIAHAAVLVLVVRLNGEAEKQPFPLSCVMNWFFDSAATRQLRADTDQAEGASAECRSRARNREPVPQRCAC